MATLSLVPLLQYFPVFPVFPNIKLELDYGMTVFAAQTEDQLWESVPLSLTDSPKMVGLFIL